jgi:spore germination protein YaaH
MDTTNGTPPAGLVAGARPTRLTSARLSSTTATRSARREVLGFAQSGEVSSGSWKSDLRLDLLTTVAYFGINVNGDGSLVTSDSGYQTWQSQDATDLINAAHASGDRVVLTVKAFNNAAIASVTGSSQSRQTAVANIVAQVAARSADGVNVDFEGFDPSVASNFVQFVAQLRGTLSTQLPNAAYLTVDTYASAALGGTMYDIVHLVSYLDAFDVMAYDITSPGSSSAGPVAPLAGMTYADVNTVSSYLSLVPASKIILGVPYYGYKWSVTGPVAQAPTLGSASADTYASVQSDLGCASQLTQHWDSTFATPWATWWSPATNDPCQGNHNSWRELYYDNAASLGQKYDLVTSTNLKGIGIWALGYDSGYQDLWNEIAAKLTVPAPVVVPLPASETTTAFTVSWSLPSGSPPAAYFAVFVTDSDGPWTFWRNVANSQSTTFYGLKGHRYGFAVEAFTPDWRASGVDDADSASTTVSTQAQSSEPFTSMYALDGYGSLHPASSPPLASSAQWPGWDVARGVALDAAGDGGAVVDAFGGLHPTGSVTAATGTFYWRGWYITRGMTLVPAASHGWVLDGFGGLHPFALGAAPLPPALTTSPYWGWDIARGVAAFSDGTGGVVLDGWGGVHPFSTAANPAVPADVSMYWPRWDIATAVTLIAGSTAAHYSGYVVDGFGGVHPFASQGVALPSLSTGALWPGMYLARGIVLIPGSTTAGYVVDRNGGFHPFGGAPAVDTPTTVTGPAMVRSVASS